MDTLVAVKLNIEKLYIYKELATVDCIPKKRVQLDKATWSVLKHHFLNFRLAISFITQYLLTFYYFSF